MSVLRMTRLLVAKQRPLLLLMVVTFCLYMLLSVFILDSSGLQEQQVQQQRLKSVEALAPPSSLMFRPPSRELSRGLVERVQRLEIPGSNRLLSEENLVQPVFVKQKVVPEFRVFHLDLKGAPPKISFLEVLLPLVRASGGNALLLEYEDMFPYEGALKNLSATNAYSKQEVKEVIALARKNSLEVIPLVQTFGHLESMLKLPEFKHLREVDVFPQEVCPSKEEAVDVVKAMVRQVVAMHPEARWLHIGCDEVFHLAACSACNDRLKELNRKLRNEGRQGEKDGRHLFLDHVRKFLKQPRRTVQAGPQQ